ncbi:MAG: hypothetical protein L6R40_002622 [Gallowayella cf. fulva]|nr:MAG: hypothetical protein L6R40_002622 [Xanthomendoza cf. fulva]
MTRIWLNSFFTMDLSILVDNQIVCGGPLPDFHPPLPYRLEDFANNQELCATQLSGGNPAANAGAYCHRARPTKESNALLMWGIRFHCWKNCLCLDKTRKKNFYDPQARMWEWLIEGTRENPTLIPTGKGSLYPLGSSTDADGNTRRSSRKSNSPTQSCGADYGHDDPRCTLPWPTEILGPVPETIKKLPLPPRPPAVWDKAKACGNECSSSSDCGGDCMWRFLSTEEARILGVDPVAPRALCLDMASIFGRSLESQGQVEWLCNATYIAAACCHYKDGIV